LPLNGHSVLHFAERLLLHYLGKENRVNYALKYAKEMWKKHS